MLELFSSLLGGILTPAVLIISSIVILPYVLTQRRGDKLPEPERDKNSTSPFRALCLALAGTLGVGNITGVASALLCGGPGAVFWMWAGAAVVLSVKYAEVYLAVKFRRQDVDGFYGGAMYYIRDGLPRRGVKSKNAEILATVFAVLCVMNSLITGNIVQSNAAASALSSSTHNSSIVSGLILGGLVLLSILYGSRKIEKITSMLIPPLTALYIIITVGIILSNASLIPRIFADIIASAFTKKAAVGGAVGFGVNEALHFGVMRGIFSNEAGCGTSPIAHASAKTNSPAAQAKLGVVEVVFDTIILCTLSAFVLLIGQYRYGLLPYKSGADASLVTLDVFGILGGSLVRKIIEISLLLFAYATIIAQLYYGTIAIGYITDSKKPLRFYYALSSLCAVFGSVISVEAMWVSADIILGVMTIVNCLITCYLRRECRK